KINDLLDNVEIRQEDTAFKIFDRDNGSEIKPAEISSGESELISLAIECLVFALNLNGKSGVLLLDEPDVHLHPDLQARFIQFVVNLINDIAFDVIIATHSTPVLAELALTHDSRICLMKAREKSLTFEQTDSIYTLLLPVFGAHPLSEIFNKTRTLLVEGDDDERIWQEAVRASGGGLKLTPIGCGGTSDMFSYETRMAQILSAVYENGKAYSLRDGDGVYEPLDDLGPVVRVRLNCYSAENLLLSDDVLLTVGILWEEVEARITAWCNADLNQAHEKLAEMKAFASGGFDRKGKKIKAIRMLLLGQILEADKPWEVLVGKGIGKLSTDSLSGPHSLRSYLGEKAVSEILGIG
ncbi:MAG: AAA family ATPase, partial [Mycobacterium sp.]